MHHYTGGEGEWRLREIEELIKILQQLVVLKTLDFFTVINSSESFQNGNDYMKVLYKISKYYVS